MSKVRYYFDEHNNDNLLRHLARASKVVLLYDNHVVKIYQKCSHLFHECSSKYIMDLVKLNSQSVVLDSNTRPKESKMAESSLTTKQAIPTEMLVHSYQDEKTNIYLDPRIEALLFSSMPRIIESSRGIEIEICVSSPQNLILTTSPVSLENSEPVADESINNHLSSKHVNLSVNESQPGFSSNISSSAEGGMTKSHPVAVNVESSIGTVVIDVEKDNLPYKSSEESRPTKIHANSSSPNTNILYHNVNQLSNLITRRENCMQSFYNSLIGFRKCLGYLILHIENILNVIGHIAMAKKYCANEDLIRNINGLIATSTALINDLVSMSLDIKKGIEFWTKCSKTIRNIKGQIEPLIFNGKLSINLNVLHKYEDDLKAKWKKMDNTIPIIETRLSLFLSTAGDFEKCINLFVKCLINVGVLKVSPTSQL